MNISIPREVFPGEARVGLTPESALQLRKLGHEVLVEKGAGLAAGFSDEAYRSAGVTVVATREAVYADGGLPGRYRHLDIRCA